LVSNPFSRRWQELPLVALPPPEKVVFNRHRLYTAVGARDFVIHKRVAIKHTFIQKKLTINKKSF
jgi:hypothetical protein